MKLQLLESLSEYVESALTLSLELSGNINRLSYKASILEKGINLLPDLGFLIVAFFGEGKAALLVLPGKKLNPVDSLSLGLTLVREPPLYNNKRYSIKIYT